MTDQQKEVIARDYPTRDLDELANELGITKRYLYVMASTMGIKRHVDNYINIISAHDHLPAVTVTIPLDVYNSFFAEFSRARFDFSDMTIVPCGSAVGRRINKTKSMARVNIANPPISKDELLGYWTWETYEEGIQLIDRVK
jgi:hypothetical protein